VSVDTELAWGESHRRDGLRHDYGTERAVIDALLELFTRYEISATWAVVGHLFLDRCALVGDRPHPDVVRPNYGWLAGDWFDIDPCSTLEEAPMFYGRDIVDAIRRCPVEQEVGCHSFSHVVADDPGCGAAAFSSDLATCTALADELGLELRSFVFPRNAIAHVELLAEHGFTCYRGRAEHPRRPRFRLFDRVWPSAWSAALPARHSSGVWNVPQTFLFAPATRPRWLPHALWARRPRVRIRQAARQRSLFHLWFHPYNISADPDQALHLLDGVLHEVARLRSRGVLDVMTMGALAESLEQGR
jgi:hypothetical protein